MKTIRAPALSGAPWKRHDAPPLTLSILLAALAVGPAATEQDLPLGADMTSPVMTEPG